MPSSKTLRTAPPIEEIAENFAIPESAIREILSFAASKQRQFQA
jgi:uncharacterized protein (DUF433 family)